jgi:hypothetical protein
LIVAAVIIETTTKFRRSFSWSRGTPFPAKFPRRTFSVHLSLPANFLNAIAIEMTDDLPPFALALKRRRQTQQQKSSPTSDHVLPNPRRLSPESPDASSSSPRPNRAPVRKSPHRLPDDDACFPDSSPPGEPGGVDPPRSRASSPDEVERLRASNADLQHRLRELEHQNREMADELADLRAEGASAARLTRSLDAAKREIGDLTALVKSKDASIASLEFQFEKLEDDYRRLADIHAADSETLKARQLEIRRMELEMEQWKRTRADDTNRRYPPPIVEAPRQFYRSPDRDLARFSPPAVRDDPPIVAEQRPVEEIPIAELSDDELRSRLEVLTREKAEKERLLNHAAPRGAKLSQIRMQKQELEEEAIRLGSLISKVKLEMRRRQIL